MKKFNNLKSPKNVNMLRSLWTNRTHMITMMKDVFAGHYKLSFMTIAMIIGALLYIVSPVDLIPDFIPVADWLDDGAIFYLLMKHLLKETNNWMANHNKKDKVFVIK